MKTEDYSLDELAEVMSVLSVKNRLRIIMLLRDFESLCVNSLACHLEISQSAVSQHLRILHLKDFVTSYRDGYYTHYSLNREKLDSSIKLLTELSEQRETVNPNKCASKGDTSCAKAKQRAKSRKI